MKPGCQKVDIFLYMIFDDNAMVDIEPSRDEFLIPNVSSKYLTPATLAYSAKWVDIIGETLGNL